MVTYEHDIYHTGVTTNTFTFTHAHRNREHLEYIKKYLFAGPGTSKSPQSRWSP